MSADVSNGDSGNLKVCPYCGCDHITRDYSRGEEICERCGSVLDEQIIDQGPDYRVFDSDQGSRIHNGPAMTNKIHDKGLMTDISKYNRDASGNSISSQNRKIAYKLRKWQRRMRISNASDRNLVTALAELDRLASAMSLSDRIRESASLTYKRAVRKNLIRGRSINGVVAASLYATCRQFSVPRTLDEIASCSNVGRKEIGRTYRFIARELRLNLLPTDPEKYVQRFCSELELSGTVQRKALDIISEARGKDVISGVGPSGVAAASIYISSIFCNERRTQRDVAEVSGVTEVTIRNRYKQLTECLGLNIQV